MKLLIFFMFFSINICLGQSTDDYIKSAMQDQEAAWNLGDIDRFMIHYWQSNDLLFVNKSGITQGWEATKTNYKIRYPDKTAMGLLKFSILRMDRLGQKHLRMIGTYHLSRSIGDLDGYFTLIWKKMNKKWFIISDHTS